MELVAKHRMREVATWSKLKKEFHDGSFDDKDVDTHQANSYLLRLGATSHTCEHYLDVSCIKSTS